MNQFTSGSYYKFVFLFYQVSCQKQCQTIPDCHFFTMFGVDDTPLDHNKCFLFKTCDHMESCPDCTSGKFLNNLKKGLGQNAETRALKNESAEITHPYFHETLFFRHSHFGSLDQLDNNKSWLYMCYSIVTCK